MSDWLPDRPPVASQLNVQMFQIPVTDDRKVVTQNIQHLREWNNIMLTKLMKLPKLPGLGWERRAIPPKWTENEGSDS